MSAITSTIGAGINVALPGVGSIIQSGLDSIVSLFSGSGRKKLTNQDWQVLIPWNGSLYSQIRSYLSARINYDVDLKLNFIPFTLNFLYLNGWDGNAQQLQNAITELSNERIQSGVTYVPVDSSSLDAFTLRVNNKTPNQSYEIDFLSNFTKYFYGTPSQVVTVPPTQTTAGTTTTIPATQTTPNILASSSGSPVILYIAIAALILFIATQKK